MASSLHVGEYLGKAAQLLQTSSSSTLALAVTIVVLGLTLVAKRITTDVQNAKLVCYVCRVVKNEGTFILV